MAFVPGAQGFAAGLFGGGSKLLTAGIAIAGAATLMSCHDDSDEPKTVINQTVNITITGNEDMPTLLDYIATLNAELKEGNNSVKAQLKAVINAISELILQNKTDAAEIIRRCGANNALLDTVIGLLIENNDLLSKNNELIQEFMNQH